MNRQRIIDELEGTILHPVEVNPAVRRFLRGLLRLCGEQEDELVALRKEVEALKEASARPPDAMDLLRRMG